MAYLYLLGCLIFLGLHGFFAASEIAFISSSLLKLRHKADKGNKKAREVYNLINEPERILTTALVGTNLCVILSASFLTFFLLKMQVTYSHLWTTFLFTPLVVIFAELIPKNIGRAWKENFSCRAVGLISFFEKLFFPLVRFIEIVSKFTIKLFTGKSKKKSLFVTKEEIKLLVKEIEKEGMIDRGEKEAIEEIFEFKRDKVKDVCVKFKKAVVLDYNSSYSRIIATVKQHHFTRYPVISSGEVIGYINIYDLFYNPHQDWHLFIRAITKLAINQKLHYAFSLLKAKKESIALVFKGKKIYGIVTLEDIMHQIITSIVK